MSADTTTTTPERAGRGVSRRRLVVGTAWAVPAVVVASAAPAVAASPGCLRPYSLFKSCVTQTGQQYVYNLTFCIVNRCGPLDATIVSVSSDASNVAVAPAPSEASFTIDGPNPDGQCAARITGYTVNQPIRSTVTLTVTYGGGTTTYPLVFQVGP